LQLIFGIRFQNVLPLTFLGVVVSDEGEEYRPEWELLVMVSSPEKSAGEYPGPMRISKA